MKLLHIDSSVLMDNSVTRELSRAVVEAWQCAHPGIDVIYRDVATEPPAHLSAEIVAARSLPAEQHSDRQRDETASGEALLQELLAADVLVVGAPMYNFSIPSQLKAWLDRVLVAGRTFRYTAAGPVGLIEGKKAVVVSARGGVYNSAAGQLMDHQESYLIAALGFVGVKDVTVIRAEGVNMEGQRQPAIAAARQQIRSLVKKAA